MTPGRRRFAVLATVTSLAAAGAVAVVAASSTSAGAASIKKELDYMCVYPVIGAQPTHLVINIDFPTHMEPGVETGQMAVSGVATINSDTVQGLRVADVGSFGGKADFFLKIASPDGNSPLKIDATVPSVTTPLDGTEDVAYTATSPSLNFANEGVGEITLGNAKEGQHDMIFHMTPKTREGGALPPQFVMDPMPCDIMPGQDTTLTFFTVGNVASPSPTPTLPPTPTPTPTDGVDIPFNSMDLKGSTHIVGPNGDGPLTGSIEDIIWNSKHKEFKATLNLNPTVIQNNVLGFLPVTAPISFTQTEITYGPLSEGKMVTHSKMFVNFPAFNVFGFFPLAGGPECATSAPIEVTLESTEKVFQPLVGGPIHGSYYLPPLNDKCGFLGFVMTIFEAWAGNTIDAVLTTRWDN